jgi:hypothetical protein
LLPVLQGALVGGDAIAVEEGADLAGVAEHGLG